MSCGGQEFEMGESATAGKDGANCNSGQPRRPLLIAVVATAATLLLLCLLLLLLLLLLPRSATEASNLCTSPACIAISAQLLHNLNLSADPCQDFASFACGGFRRREAFGPDTIGTGLGVLTNEAGKQSNRMFELFTQPELARSVDDVELDQLFNATRDTFLACAGWFNPRLQWLPNSSHSRWGSSDTRKARSTEALVEPLVREINQTWPTLESHVAHLVMTGFSGLLRLVIITSPGEHFVRNSRKRGPVLGLQAMEFNFKNEWNTTVADEIEELRLKYNIVMRSSANEVVKIQNTIFQLNNSETFKGTLTDLQKKSAVLQSTLVFNWTSFVDVLQMGLVDDFVTLRVDFGRLADLVEVLNMLASGTAMGGAVHDFLLIDAVMSLRNFLPEKKFPALRRSYTDRRFLFDPNEKEIQESGHFIGICQEMVATAMTPVTFRMFRAAYPEEYSPELMHGLIWDVKRAMKKNVDESSWLGIQSKLFMLTKINVMRQVVAYHEFSLADIKKLFMYDLLQQRFSKEMQVGDIVIACKLAQSRLLLFTLTSNTVPWYLLLPMTVFNPFHFNAFYLSPSNTMEITLGIMDSYMYSKDYPRYLQYGGIGSVIGHEIGHAFSPASCYLDENGQPSNSTLDPETNRTYLDRVGCLTSFYSTLKMTASVRVTGTQTVGENLADIVGINAAFRAYRDSLARSQRFEQQLLPGLSTALSPDQLFFVQAAQFNCEKLTDAAALEKYRTDVHSPGAARILGTMSQSVEFARVFGCKPGDKMHLPDADRCPLW